MKGEKEEEERQRKRERGDKCEIKRGEIGKREKKERKRESVG